ncbi:hypothetical protein [Aquimarina sp. TRL1]|uniref:hypothetical protein n=1 Tax=Aquimarina sp. (strain TRL1) TaxID=2736252 RepID=UPI001C37DE5D|nr:hypothetical protein [Aquimarina sp. TRL1]
MMTIKTICFSIIVSNFFLSSVFVFSQDARNKKIDSINYYLDNTAFFDSKIVAEFKKSFSNDSLSIYYNPVGYDNLILTSSSFKKDTILKKKDIYYKKLITVDNNTLKDSLRVDFNDFEKFIKVKLKTCGFVKSVVLIPHIEEHLIKDSEIIQGNINYKYEKFEKNYVDIHYLTFDYYDYLKRKLSVAR